MIIFLDRTLAELQRHAECEYPAECCGILAGRLEGGNKTVRNVYPVRNTAVENNNVSFSIDPLEIMRAERYTEQNSLEIVGFYHSHPDYGAVASDEDIQFMIPGYSYPIISVRSGKAAEIRCYVKADNTAFCEELILRRDENADNSLHRGNAAGICE